MDEEIKKALGPVRAAKLAEAERSDVALRLASEQAQADREARARVAAKLQATALFLVVCWALVAVALLAVG